MAQTELKMPNL